MRTNIILLWRYTSVKVIPMFQRNQRQFCLQEVCLLVRIQQIRFATLKSNNTSFSWDIENRIIFLCFTHKRSANNLVVAEQLGFFFFGRDFASIFCSFAVSSLEQCDKGDECLFRINSCQSEVPVDLSYFSHDNSNISHSFYKNLGNTCLKSYN